ANGEANVDCDAARAAFGLPALQPEFETPFEQIA
ncbi:YkgJ family cysteine cluster protein, partial [Pseudomonas sp. FW305-BF6]